MQEIWKDIAGYEGYYQVSNFGRVKRFGSVKNLKPGDNGHGYLYVNLSVKNKTKSFYVHRLVAIAFIENPLDKKTVNHVNGNKSDNSIENLEWATQSENSQHGFDTGLIRQNKGKDNPGNRAVVQKTINGDVLNTFYSLKNAMDETGVFSQNIGACCSGKYKQAGGYKWEYVK